MDQGTHEELMARSAGLSAHLCGTTAIELIASASTIRSDMGFILDGLETEAYDRTYSDRELLRRIVSYFRPYAGRWSWLPRPSR